MKTTKRRYARLEKIDRAENALIFAIRAAEEKAQREDLPTDWMHVSLKYLVRLAKDAA